jgi:Ca-activated chloride channel family protein
MSFANYKYLFYFLPMFLGALLFFVFYMWWRRHAIFITFKGRVPQYLQQGRLLIWREVILLICLVLFFILVLRPQWGERMKEVRNEGTDLLIALDVSRSMLANDVKPSRMKRAKDSIQLLVESLAGDRLGLILFAGDSFMQCPFTSDKSAFLMFLDSVDTSSVALQGTNLSAALRNAEEVFAKKNMNSKILLLITDGEDHEGNIDEIVNKLKENGVIVYTAGIGDEKGSLIPLDSDDASGDLYLRENGELVRAKVDVALLKKIASKTGGEYIDLTNDMSGITRMGRVLSSEAKNQFGSKLIKERKEQYQWLAFLLVVLLLLEMFLVERRKSDA